MIRDVHLPVFILSLLIALALQAIGLPDALAPFRPLLLPLALAYWAVHSQQTPVLLAGWLLGLCCDVLYGAPLGQYALGLVAVAYTARRFSGALLVFPLWQATLALMPVWGVYVFLMFWIDGLTHHPADPLRRWLPLLSTVPLWPVAVGLFGGLGRRRGMLR